MFKKILLSIGVLGLSTNLLANKLIFSIQDLDDGLKKHTVCIYDSLQKIVDKNTNMAKIDESYYDLNNIIDRYNFISEQRENINFDFCDKESTYVITILESFNTEEKDIIDWKDTYTSTVISSELTNLANFNKGKELKSYFDKNKNKNNEIVNKMNKIYDLVLEEDKKTEYNKDITSERDIFN